MLQPGERRAVTSHLRPRDLAFYCAGTHDWVGGRGDYSIRVGDSSAALPLTQRITIGKDLHIPLSE